MDNMGTFLLVLHFMKGWSLVITALLILHERLEFGSNRSSNPSSRQSILTGAQLEFDGGSFQQNCV